jgi:hypothetical protein
MDDVGGCQGSVEFSRDGPVLSTYRGRRKEAVADSLD